MNSQKDTFEFKYQGDIEAIDINTLINSQLQYTCILNEIKNQLFPEVELKIRVQSFEKNSFDLNQIIEIFVVSGNIVFQNVEYIFEIFKFLKLYLDIKKLLGDKKPDRIEEVGNNNVSLTININGNDNNIVVSADAFKFYQNNYTVHKSLKKNGHILAADAEVEGVQIIDKKRKVNVIDIPRNDFAMLSTTNAYINKDINEDIKDNAILYIKKLDLNPQKTAKWDFIFEGRIINSVSISDENFLRQVKEGEKFGNGDRLNCRLKTTQKLDVDTGAYLDCKYEIITVNNIIRKNEQLTIL